MIGAHVLRNFAEAIREQVQPTQQVNVLFGHRELIFAARIVVESTTHEVSLAALILAMPTEESVC